MISIADLTARERNPQAAYPEYDEVRKAAQRRNGGFTDPADLPRIDDVTRRRGIDWCRAVTGKPILGGVRSTPATDAVMLLIADERDLDPPRPAWLLQCREESEARDRAVAERRDAALRRDRETWNEALKTCGVPVEVRPALHGRRYGAVLPGEPLRHAVPLENARSSTRLHQAGRPLCESRRTPRQLGDPVSEPATCKACIKYTAEIQPAAAARPAPAAAAGRSATPAPVRRRKTGDSPARPPRGR